MSSEQLQQELEQMKEMASGPLSTAVSFIQLENKTLSFTEPASPLVGKTKSLGLVFSTASFGPLGSYGQIIKLYEDIQKVEIVPRMVGKLLEPFAGANPDETSNYVMTIELSDDRIRAFLSDVDAQVQTFALAWLAKQGGAPSSRSGSKRKVSQDDGAQKHYPIVREGYREGSPHCVRIKVVLGGHRETAIYRCGQLYNIPFAGTAEPQDLYELLDVVPGTLDDLTYGKRVATIVDAQTVWIDTRAKTFGLSVYARAIVVMPDPVEKASVTPRFKPLSFTDF
jgi:hypothetical protein